MSRFTASEVSVLPVTDALITLVIFHAQNYYVNKASFGEHDSASRSKDPRVANAIASQRYLNQVVHVIQNGFHPITHIVVVNDVHNSDEATHCLKDSEEAKLYPPLETAIDQWSTGAFRTVARWEAPCCTANGAQDGALLDHIATDLREHLAPAIDAKTHEVVIAGLFHHPCTQIQVPVLNAVLKAQDNCDNTWYLAPLRQELFLQIADGGREIVPFEYFGIECAKYDRSELDAIAKSSRRLVKTHQLFDTAEKYFGERLRQEKLLKDKEKKLFQTLLDAEMQVPRDINVVDYRKDKKDPYRITYSGIYWGTPMPTRNPVARGEFFLKGAHRTLRPGANQHVTIAMFHINEDDQLMVFLKDEKALPTTLLHHKETAAAGAQRFMQVRFETPERRETLGSSLGPLLETDGFRLESGFIQEWVIYRGYVVDARNTLRSWVETTCIAVDTQQHIEGMVEVSDELMTSLSYTDSKLVDALRNSLF